MCTAITYSAKHNYFGRNLDLEYHYEESVTITPRNFPFHYRGGTHDKSHYAIIGVATLKEGYPLYYDAVNEHGLCMAGLNFVGNAVYHDPAEDKENISPFELIPRILCQCKSTDEARAALENINLTNIPFSEDLPLAELHWLISDKEKSIVAEPTRDGLKIYDDPVGVLTNNPPFDFHMQNLAGYLNLSPLDAKNNFSDEIELVPYSRGMGAIGLPGDVSSASRFVRASFVKLNSAKPQTEEASVSQFFHILQSVEQVEGCVRLEKGLERTQYSSCCNTDTCAFYYKTYTNSCITKVELFGENVDSDTLISYPLIWEEKIHSEN